MSATATNGAAVDALHAEVDELRAELTALRDGLATEVRTRRLVVVDAQGRETLFTENYDGAMQLRLRWPFGPGEDDYTEVVMHAGSEEGDGLGRAGLSLGASGDVIGTFGVVSESNEGRQHVAANLDMSSATRYPWSGSLDLDRALRVRPDGAGLCVGSWVPVARATFHVIDGPAGATS